MRATWLIGLVVLACCKREPVVPLSETPAGVASTTEQDALWKLAPAGASLGLVASPRGIAMAERYLAGSAAVQAAAPELASMFRPFDDLLREAIGTPRPVLAEFGLTHDKGFAMFTAQDDSTVVVVPVVDRDKFVAKLHGTRGADDDAVKGAVCKPIGDRYICAQKRELFAKLGAGGLDTMRTAAGARGDLEFAATIEGGRTALAAEVSPGALTVRGVLGGLPPHLGQRIGKPSRPPAGAAAAGGFGVFDLTPFFMLSELPPLPIVPGVTLAGLARTVAGPASFVIPAGTSDLGIRIPLSDPAPARSVLEHCAEVPPLAAAGATSKDGVCHFTVPRVGLGIDAWVEGNELRIGSRAAAAPISIEPTPLAAEIASSEWAIAFFGRGSFLDLTGLPAAAAMMKASPMGTPIARQMPLVNELVLAVRKDGDALRLVLGVRTIWANSDDVVQKLLAITSEQILSGEAAEIGRSIAKAAPGSPFAQDLKAGTGGILGLAVPVGLLAAVAVPAFMDYMKRSKKSEAELRLSWIARHAKRVYAESGAFPKGSAPLTPPSTCCGGPDNHCVTPLTAWQQPVWKALEFKVDGPSLFQYSYESDGKTFTAKAVGDLDCDGVTIAYELRGTSEGGQPTATLNTPRPNAD
jgi:type II secretory pathway pseudopilin PulG